MSDDTRECPVCLESFNIKAKTPRILPCSHSVCDVCLLELLGNNPNLVCPQCRQKHAAKSGVKSFPENKYILRNLTEKFSSCSEHDRQLSLYCKNRFCDERICQLCYFSNHKDHDVVDIIKEGDSRSEFLKNFAEECRAKLVEARRRSCQRNRTTLDKLFQIKTDIVELFDEHIKEVRISEETEGRKFKQQITKFENVLCDIADIDKGEKLKTIERLEHSVRQFSTRKMCYSYQTYCCEEGSFKDLKKFVGSLKECKEKIAVPLDFASVKLATNEIVCMCPLDDDTMAVCERTANQHSLMKYDTQGKITTTVDLGHSSTQDMTEMELHGRRCVAISLGEENRIEFRPSDNLHIVTTSIHLGAEEPRCLTAAFSTLVYQDFVDNHENVINCEKCPLMMIGSSGDEQIIDACFTAVELDLDDFDLVHVKVLESGDVSARFNFNSSESWVSKKHLGDNMDKPMKAHKVAASRKNRFFVTDINNNCIQMFSVSGEYLGSVLKPDDDRLQLDDRLRGRVKFDWIRRFEKSFLFFVGYSLQDEHFASILRIQ